MIKKCLIFSLLALTLPVMYVKAECSEAQIEAYRKELENVTFDLEYIPKGTEVTGFNESYNVQDTNLIKVTSPNMPKEYMAHFVKNAYDSYMVSSQFYSFLTGGVYTVRIQSLNCNSNEPIKVFTIMLPHYDTAKSKNDAWFDGTYISTNRRYNTNTKIKIDSRLLAALISLVLVVLIITIILLKKRRRNSL